MGEDQQPQYTLDPTLLIDVLNERLSAVQRENIQLLALVRQVTKENSELQDALVAARKAPNGGDTAGSEAVTSTTT